MGNPEGQVEPSLIPALDPSLLQFSDEERAFLHASISPDEDTLKTRIYDVQKRADYPYPCIRMFHFVNLMMKSNAVYPSVLAAGKRGDTLFLDLGCCMGTDVRKLVYDGYPASRVLGCDLRPEYIQLGHELFDDATTCPIHFFTYNVFDLPTSVPPPSGTGLSDTPAPNPTVAISTVTDLAQLRGSLTHVYTGALFHLFDEETQHGLAVRLATLLKREPGAIVFGRHQGLREEGYIDDHLGRKRYGHSGSSWERLWKRVFTEVEGEAFTSRVIVQTDLREGPNPHLIAGTVGHQSYMLYWSVQIV
ncbi:hypothetical protein C8Q79DRAFT_1000700 [Trametes meyenii]|nr:hypothetical protein C8Q79DRAFT_1000700 [Trametes meyenii]